MTEKFTHHELTVEWVNDKQGRAIMLTQPADNYEEPDTVLIHPWQLRAVCEQFGIIASDPQAEKTIALLRRRLLALRDRVDFLHNYLVNHSDHKHADLTFELTYAMATIDIADEFCAEWRHHAGCRGKPSASQRSCADVFANKSAVTAANQLQNQKDLPMTEKSKKAGSRANPATPRAKHQAVVTA